MLDSEWHWIFDCPHFSILRSKYPFLSNSMDQVKIEADGSPSSFAVAKHIGDLMNVIQLDFSVGTSLASMIHKMIQLRKEWLVTVGCARGRLCEAPDSWGRDIFFTPPSAAELTPVLGADFESGRPWHFRFENQNMIFSSYCRAALFKFLIADLAGFVYISGELFSVFGLYIFPPFRFSIFLFSRRFSI